VSNSVIQAAAGKAADRLDIGHIQAIENDARRRLGAEVGAENFRLRTPARGDWGRTGGGRAQPGQAALATRNKSTCRR
jgi:hypothetical protein